MAKNIALLTNEEINKVFKIAKLDRKKYTLISRDISREDYETIKNECEEGEIFLSSNPEDEIYFEKKDHTLNLTIDKDGIFTYGPNREITPINNTFQVAQYLIDKGYRFDI